MDQDSKNTEETTVRCFFEEHTDDGFNAVGILHEDIVVIVDQDIERGSELNTGLWYEIDGTILERDSRTSMKIKVDSEEDIEEIGSEIDDWLERRQKNARNIRVQPTSTSDNRFGRQLNTMSTNADASASPTGNMESLRYSASNDKGMTTSVDMEKTDSQSDISGFATGGGKDINNFRDNISKGYLPHPDSVSHEGVFYDYEFNLSGKEKDSMFYPVYEQAVTDSLSDDTDEHYLAVGLESGIESFSQPPLDLMLVVDVSGSMGQSMNDYYYDDPKSTNPNNRDQVSKIEATREVLKKIVSKLGEEDRFGVTLYNNEGWVSKPLRLVSRTDVDAIIDHVDDISDGGGTNMSEGYEKAVTEMTEYADIDTEDMSRESRIMFLTDAMPNAGTTGKQEITDLIEDKAEDGIHTTYIGIGVDANPELISQLSKVKGSNHYFVSSAQEFREKVAEKFEYITTPLVFDLNLTIEGDGFDINGVYGSPNESSETSGQVMSVNTLFPSTGDEGTKGGVILVELQPNSLESEVRISATWNRRDGQRNSDVRSVDIHRHNPTYYETDEVRKAVVLKNYVETLESWLSSQEIQSDTSQWERKSNPIELGEDQRSNIENLRTYMRSNNSEISQSLDREIEVLDSLLD